jgi:hypothetical protein
MSDDETRSVNGRSVRMLVADDDEGIPTSFQAPTGASGERVKVPQPDRLESR